MDKPTQKNDYLLLFRGTGWHRDLSPQEIQTTMTAWTEWFTGLVKDGRCKGGHPLEAKGRVVSGKNGAISDGPFAETKEAVGGYFYLQVESEEEAVEIARQCPALDYGLTVEVRPVVPSCPALDYVADAKNAEAQRAQMRDLYAELATAGR
jgi:hypothetical protein